MAGAKLVIVYPQPLDVSQFEEAYLTDHLPMAQKGLIGATLCNDAGRKRHFGTRYIYFERWTARVPYR